MKKIYKKISSSILCQDTVSCAQIYSLALEPGDIIISASDGVFDNLFNYEILEIVKKYRNKLGEAGLTMETTAHASTLSHLIGMAAISKFKGCCWK